MLFESSTGASSSSYQIQLDTPAFGIILAVLALFFLMFFYLKLSTTSKRALAGFIEATEVDVAFLGASVILLLYLAANYPSGNHIAWAISQVILQGYWLALAIPIVTVGNTVHGKTRGALAWRDSSIVLALILFAVLFFLNYT
jgi:hypothetical protein